MKSNLQEQKKRFLIIACCYISVNPKMQAFLKGGKITSEPKSKEKSQSEKPGASGDAKPAKKNVPWVEK